MASSSHGSEMASIRVGQPIALLLPDNTSARGTVARIVPSLDPQSLVALVYADLGLAALLRRC
jgi:hypothetical protein